MSVMECVIMGMNLIKVHLHVDPGFGLYFQCSPEKLKKNKLQMNHEQSLCSE